MVADNLVESRAVESKVRESPVREGSMQGSRWWLVRRYGAALPAVAAAICIRQSFNPILGQAFPGATLFLAILLMAWSAGRGPALLTTILGGLGSAWFFFEPLHSLAIHGLENQAALVFYLIIGSGIALLGGSMRSAQSRAEANEAEANTRRDLLRVTLTSIGDGVITTDWLGLIQFMNPVAEALTGWTSSAAAGQPIDQVFRIIDEGTRAAVSSPVARVIGTGQIARLANDSILIARNGTETAIGDTAAPIQDAHGKLVGVVLVFQDASHRRQVEAALRGSEERLRYTLDATKVGQWDLDLSTDTAIRSLRHDQVFGYDTLLPEWSFDLFLNQHVHPDDRVRVQSEFQEAANGGRDWETECRITRADGVERWIWVKSGVYLSENGKPARMLGLVLDVTNQKRAEEAARAARDEAEEANRAKDRFLAVLSHELRTPLNPILLATTAMLDRPLPPSELPATLRMIRTNVEIQARLIDDLLDVMRIVRGKMPLYWEVVDAHALIRQAITICQSDVAGKQLTLTTDLQASDHFLNADPARFQQVIWNLTKNAIKFTPAGGSITVQTRNDPAQGDTLNITISDTGIGIDPAVLPLIFDPFQQGEMQITRKFGGLGLGLAICKGVVEAHGGTLTAGSGGVGQGSTLQVSLPFVPRPQAFAAPRPEIQAPAKSGSPPTALKILVVEDDPATRRLMTRLLRDLGHEVTARGTVAEAVAAATDPAIHLIISDIGLPDGSGLDLIRQISAHRDQPIPAIALTGYGMEEDVLKSRHAGFTTHMTKPIDFTRLAAVIQEVMMAPETTLANRPASVEKRDQHTDPSSVAP